jgi:hypothetical protein
MAHLLNARTLKPAETAVDRKLLLLGNSFVRSNNGVTGKRCILRTPVDSYVMKSRRTVERYFLCGPCRGFVYIRSRLCIARELQLKGASQRGQKPLNTEADEVTVLGAVTGKPVKTHKTKNTYCMLW